MSTVERPLRADAGRNRQAIICAAGSVFATEGIEVTLERIAQAAGVGVGTIYRRFRTVDELLSVVLEEKMIRYADEAERAAERSTSEPWDAFRSFVMFMLEQQATDLAFSDVIIAPAQGSELFRTEIRRALKASNLLVERVKKAGAIRADFDRTDFYMLLHANAGLVRGTHQSAPLAWKRFAEYMLQAFASEGGVLAAPSRQWMRASAGGKRPDVVTPHT